MSATSEPQVGLAEVGRTRWALGVASLLAGVVVAFTQFRFEACLPVPQVLIQVPARSSPLL
jgi:hypothetical protein